MSMISRIRGGAVAVGVALALAIGGASTPAHAAVSGVKASTGCQAGGRVGVKAFGYQGYLKCNSTMWRADYDRNGTVDEIFGVAPNGDVYHVWPGSGGWKRLDNGNVNDLTGVYFQGRNHRELYGVKNGRTWVDVYDNVDFHRHFCYITPRWQGWYLA